MQHLSMYYFSGVVMKLVILLCFVCCVFTGWGQHTVSRAAIRNGGWKEKPDNATTLAYQLTARTASEKEKVVAIFDWITANIAYHTRPWNQWRRTGSKNEIEDPSDTATVLKPLDERVADLVIRRGEAYCDGYARLFKTLCDLSGIQAEVITGYSRTPMDKSGNKFSSNHTWNAVRIDSTWHLLDATWASGFLTFSGNEFIRRYDGAYFLTPPKQFIADHYPEDLRWTLLPDPPSLREYQLSPYKQQGYVRAKVTSYKPEKGVITAMVGDTVYLAVESGITKPDPMKGTWTVDNSTRPTPATWTYLTPTSAVEGKLLYAFAVESTTIEYLNLVYDDNVLLRYKLNILPAAIQVVAVHSPEQ